MAKIIKLKDEVYVASDNVSEITVSAYRTHVNVLMKNGNKYSIDAPYGKSVWEFSDELMATVNAANGSEK